MPLTFAGPFAGATTLGTLHQDPRHRNSENLYKFVRRLGNRWQARVYRCNAATRFSEHVNLGLYDSEAAAYFVAREFVLHGRRPAHLLPKFIRRCAGGRFVGIVRLKAGTIVLRTSRFATADDADQAMRRLIKSRWGEAGIARFYPFG